MKRPLSGVLLSVLACAGTAAAQDAHYWNYGYGPVGQLTKGALVGGVSDLSAVYYNPAACALMKEPRFVLALNSIQLANIDVPDAAGQGLDFDQVVFSIIPSMVAGHVGHHDPARKDHFAWAFLARHHSDFDLVYSTSQISAENPDGAAGYGRFRQRLVEYWVGGSWSRRVGERISVGLSPFVAHRGQRSRRSLSLEETTAAASSAAFVGREAEYNHLRGFAKLGVAWRPGRWELGTTLTTASVRLWGSGKSLFNASLSGGAVAPFLSAASQDGLAPTYRSPWSIAAGATRRSRRTTVHTTVEWFSSVDPYDVLQPDPAPIAGSSETIDLTTTGAARSVFNSAIGLERSLGQRFVLYAGAARNHSSFVPQRDTFTAWDLTEVTAGFTFDRGGPKWALGLGYGWGSNELPQVIAPPGPTPPATRPANYSRWTISIGAALAGR